MPVLLPDQAHAHLGMRMRLTGDLAQEKARVAHEVRLRLSAWHSDRLLPPLLKEPAITMGVVSVLRCSPGVGPCSKTESDPISRSWGAAYKQACMVSPEADS